MAVHQGAAFRGFQRQAQASGRVLAHQELLEGQRELRHGLGGIASDQARDLVAEPENAARLEPHHRHAARDIGRERIQRALHLLLRLGDRADREKSPAAAERAG